MNEFDRAERRLLYIIPRGKCIMIVKGSEEIEFFTRFEPTRKGPPIYFWEKAEALGFLSRISMNSWDRSTLRTLLAKVEGALKVGKLNDEEILDLLADCLVSGRIWAVRVRLLKRSTSRKPEREYMTPLEVSRAERKPQPAPPKKEEEKPPPPPPAEPEVSPEVAAAQASVLKEASESGKPFCEQ
jgi:hypothetical protein